MGLDQHAYVAIKENSWDDYYGSPLINGEYTGTRPREICYWRKHPNLEGWMSDLWREKEPSRETAIFNCMELELTWEDLDRLEADIKRGAVAELDYCKGFLFGNPSDNYYYNQDLQFIKDARAELFSGLRVFYKSSW